MGTILHFESAASSCSVAVSRGKELLFCSTSEEAFKHAENLLVTAQECLQKAGISFQELDAIAVSAGPGSYTGLRIGVSAAKGMAYALEIPLIAINTLEIMSRGFISRFPDTEGVICPMLDARRMEVYTAEYTSDLQVLTDSHPLVVEAGAYSDALSLKPHWFFGDGAMKCQEAIGMHPNAHFVDLPQISAEFMVIPAWEAFEKKQFADLAYFEPDYLKPYQGTPPKPASL